MAGANRLHSLGDNMRDGGKGDAPRPINNREQFENNWDAIFKKKTEPEPIPFAGMMDIEDEKE